MLQLNDKPILSSICAAGGEMAGSGTLPACNSDTKRNAQIVCKFTLPATEEVHARVVKVVCTACRMAPPYPPNSERLMGQAE